MSPHRFLLLLVSVLVSLRGAYAGVPPAPDNNEIAWSIGYDPKTLDPAKVDDEASNTVRYLTGGVLLRLNRTTLAVEPALAQNWKLSPDGHLLTFRLRQGLRFSDGSPLTSNDVVATLRRVLDPATEAPVAEEFLAAAKITADAPDPLTVRVHLPERIAAVENNFDEIPIEPAGRSTESRITAGPFTVAEYKRGQYLRLKRNPYFWRHDAAGRALPYLDSLRLEMLGNREAEQVRFVRGQYALIEDLPAEAFDALSRRAQGSVHDLGPSLNTEQFWFNQAPQSPLPAWEKAWFSNLAFRTAVSLSIQRADLAKVAFAGHATAANGFVSPGNTFWYNRALAPARYDPNAAAEMLRNAGFRKQGATLVDAAGHPVRFSILTNSGNRARERMATMIQQDLARLGMQVSVVTLDYPALIERLMHTSDYQAALLGLGNVEPDPSSMMNVWLSSSPNHQWNPAEKSPATPWEAEIDALMHTQAESRDPKVRKRAVDRVQAIVAEQLPFLYLVYPNVLCAASPALENVRFSVLFPTVTSNVDEIRWKSGHP